MRLASGMEIGYKVLGPQEHLPWHVHDAATLCVVLGGSVEEEDDARTRRRTTGDLVFRPRPERHRNRICGTGAQMFILEIGTSAMEALTELGLPRRDPVFSVSPRAVHLARLARAELQGGGPAIEIELMGLAYELLSTVVRRAVAEHERPPEWLVRIHARLREEYRRPPKLGDLAGPEGIPAYRLSQVFRKHYGTSIGGFLQRLRVDRAIELLCRDDLALVEVALESGFYDQSHLTNVFRQYTGHTPAAFRRRSLTKSVRGRTRSFPESR